MEDLKKIKYISEEVDVKEPGVALRLYTLIRQKDIRFQSPIGDDYLLYLSDLVADDCKEMSDRPKDEDSANSGRSRSPRKVVGILCIVAAVLCFAYFIGSEAMDLEETRQMQEIQRSKDISRAAEYIADRLNQWGAGEEEDDQEASQGEAEEQEVVDEEFAAQGDSQEEMVQVPLTVLPEYADLHLRNTDMVGWLTIPGTQIDYPVMQSPEGVDAYYYLKHSFEKEEDHNGSIFLDQRNDLQGQDDNLILYGHNMKSGAMFGTLKLYLEEDYLAEHPQISFSTLYEKRVYDIIAVCLAKVEYQDEEGFRYYNFLDADSRQAFDEFKANVIEMNVYGEDVDMEYGDKLITLSTCNSYVEDGRMFVVAKLAQ